ncbi:MAG: hypothetical protein ACK5HR_05390 [Mycoplasmatales bacterium]
MKKKVLGIILYIILIIFLIKVDDFAPFEDVTYYSDIKVEDLKNINIDVANVEVDIVTSPFDEIAITRTTSNRKNREISYSSNYVDNTLTIKQYRKKNIDDKLKDKLSIQIPENNRIEKLNLTMNDGKVLLNGVTAKETSLKTNNSLNLIVENSNFNTLDINAINIQSSLKNTVIDEMLTYDIAGGSINDNNVTGGEEKITNTTKLEYFNESSFFEKTNFLGKNVEISFILSPSKNYYFTEVKNKLNKSYLDQTNTNYKYFKDEKSIKKYTINVNNNKIVNIEEQEKKEEI